MHPARIAELLKPFLSPTINSCHSEPGPSPGEACPEQSREPALSLPKGEPAVTALLSATQLQTISTYIDILQHWNARINLTAIRNEEEIVTRHFGESFFLANHLWPRNENKNVALAPSPAKVDSAPNIAAPAAVLDVGSGAGFPGLPIKLWAPDIHLTLIESNHKKATFLREVARALTSMNVDIINARTETLVASDDCPKADLVTMRAVESFETVLPQLTRFLSTRGTLALLISEPQLRALDNLTNLNWEMPSPIPLSERRIIVIGRLSEALRA
jgi:16S rRNA (guanine527-N7)-methyltransferase